MNFMQTPSLFCVSHKLECNYRRYVESLVQFHSQKGI